MGQRVSEPMPVLDLLKQYDGLIVLGDPGAGKTTFSTWPCTWPWEERPTWACRPACLC